MFISNGLDIISYKRTAENAHLSGTYSFLKQPEKAVQPHMQDYAAVLYGGHWWISRGNFFRSKNEIYDSTWTTKNILLACPFSNILKS